MRATKLKALVAANLVYTAGLRCNNFELVHKTGVKGKVKIYHSLGSLITALPVIKYRTPCVVNLAMPFFGDNLAA